ncbi:hypothetical protein KAR91_24640 [Candidatus Pacearchaeota archaeon]|nr:hypothetical protein [Candidatus Pacearchaeota archaeon]
MIIYNSNFAASLKVNGITIWPFIFISCSKKDCPEWLLKHEQVHIKQQINWFILPFYIVYLWDYAIYRLKGYNHDTAYRSIRFEVEAYKKANP